MTKPQPKIRGTICTNADPEGCKANVDDQITKIEQAFDLKSSNNHSPVRAPRKVLVIGGSAGYGLASKLVSLFGYGADVYSISFEKAPRGPRSGTAGFYNDQVVSELCENSGQTHINLCADAFAEDTKQQMIEQIKANGDQIDLVVYSLAAPKRSVVKPDGESHTYQSTIKPIGTSWSGRSIDIIDGKLKDFSVEPANEDEIANTVAVMGGEDWYLWMKALAQAEVLSDSTKTVAFSYLGGPVTEDIYRKGTLGKAKEDLEAFCQKINDFDSVEVSADVAVLKAIVTQSSAAIPSLALYISALYKVMKANNVHEGCVEQIIRLFKGGLYPLPNLSCDKDLPYRFRLDNLELEPRIQEETQQLVKSASDENLLETTDYKGFKEDFLKLFGFGWES